MIGTTDTPEQRFIASIILRAYADMLSKDNGDARWAMSFLTTSYGDTARWRNHLCSLLGIDGDLLARRVRRQLDGEQPIPYPYETNDLRNRATILKKHEAQVAAARKRWLHLKKPHASRVPPASSVEDAEFTH
jgi:hypothetical protein